MGKKTCFYFPRGSKPEKKQCSPNRHLHILLYTNKICTTTVTILKRDNFLFFFVQVKYQETKNSATKTFV